MCTAQLRHVPSHSDAVFHPWSLQVRSCGRCAPCRRCAARRRKSCRRSWTCTACRPSGTGSAAAEHVDMTTMHVDMMVLLANDTPLRSHGRVNVRRKPSQLNRQHWTCALTASRCGDVAKADLLWPVADDDGAQFIKQVLVARSHTGRYSNTGRYSRTAGGGVKWDQSVTIET